MKHRRSSLLLTLSILVGGVAPAQTGRARVEAPRSDALVEQVRRTEYDFSAVRGEPGVWSAPNRGQELRSRVSPQGLEVFPRVASADGIGAPWTLRLATASFGRTDGALELPPAKVRVADARIELAHGHLVEWFVNEERGIEQGWTIAARPAGAAALSIELAIESELALRIEEGARSGVFVDACGEPVLRYRDLLAFDATGRELEARLEPCPTGVAIIVDDAGALYPLTVDPLFTSPAWTAESDQADANLGTVVATAGDVNGDGNSDVIVGAPWFDAGLNDEGRAFVFHGSSSGLATSPSWTAESNLEDATFGFGVSTAGDVNGDGYSDVIVGAPYAFFGEQGHAYVFHGGASGLASSPAWTVSGGENFAYSVSTAGDVNGDGYSDVIVPGPDSKGDYRVFVYHGSSTGLSATPEIDLQGGALVSTGGDVNGDGYSEIAYTIGRFAVVWHGSPNGVGSPLWTFEYPFEDVLPGLPPAMELLATTAGDVNGDGYGDLLVGVYQYDPEYFYGPLVNGDAFVFLGSSSGLPSSPDWVATPFQLEELFRGSIGTAGDVNGDGFSDVIVGQRSINDDGAAYVYYGTPGGLATSPVEIVAPTQPEAYFGWAVSTAGDVNGDGYSDVLVGQPGYDGGQPGEGRVYAYHGAPIGLADSPSWTHDGGAVSTAGDVNGDGYSDVIVGDSSYDGGEIDEGRAFVFHGSAGGLNTNPAWIEEGDQEDALFGNVGFAGDVNGDGYSDVIIGATHFDNGEVNEGRAFVYHGSASGLATAPAWTAESNQAEANFGAAVANAGDVNGDGFADVIIGAHFWDGGQMDEGRAYLYLGSASGLAASPAWTAESNQVQAYLGFGAAGAGDLNRDGYGDVIVSAYGYDAGQLNEGRVYAYHGSPAGIPASPSWTIESNLPFAHMGMRVSTAGDVNGDGYSDVLIAAPVLSNGESLEGRVDAYHGSASGLAASPAWTVESNEAQAWFGFGVATAGDVNGDGYSDVIIGSSFIDSATEGGRAHAYFGSASGLQAEPVWTVESEEAGEEFGFTVSTAGDVNGDGYSDVLVGALDSTEGSAFLFMTNAVSGGGLFRMGVGPQAGLVRQLQQRTADGVRPLAIGASTGVNGLFRIRCEFPKNAAGTSWAAPGPPTAHLEWEVKPLGVPFDGADIQSGAPQSLQPAGGTLVFDELAWIDGRSGRALTTRAFSCHWRARVATNNPLFPNTAWFSVQGSALHEAKLMKPARQLR